MASNTPSSMICFKNGYSYVNIPVALTSDQPICEGTNIRECEVGPLPNFAVHGTVSLAPHTPESVKIFSISQAPTKILPVTKKTCKTLPLKIPQNDEENDFSYENVLIENIGNAINLTCLVQTGAKETARERTFTGIIKSVYKDFRGNGQGLVVLKALEPNAGEKMIKCSSILFLETIPLPDEGSDDEEDVVESGRQRRNDGMESVKSISVRYAVDKTHSEDKVVANLSYLTQGLLWAPSYMLRQDKKSKTMTLQGNACLLCDLPFFKGNSIDSVALVAGQPKMECQNICDPLASGITAAQFKSQLDRLDPIQIPIRSDRTGRRDDYRRRELSSMMHMGSLGPIHQPRSYDDDLESAEGVATGEKMQDLYFYKLRNVPLHYNRPMSLPFIEECSPGPYQDVYFFDLNTKGEAGGNDDTMVDATHAITFKNTSGQPFTTGPVSVLMAKGSTHDLDDKNVDAPKKNKGNNFLVQGRIKSTGPNKTATVELTKALDVEGKFAVEISKEQQIEEKKKINDDDYELRSVQTTGTLTVTNMKNEEVKCKVDHLLRGHLEKSDPTHVEVTETQTGHHDLNPTAKYVWEIKVPAKGKADLVFKYCIKEWIKANEEPLKTLRFRKNY